jgi:hypothetical protein
MDLIALREKYIRYIHAKRDSMFYINHFFKKEKRKKMKTKKKNINCCINILIAAKAEENIDPDYKLQYGVTCDIAFLDLEALPAAQKAMFTGRARLKIASNLPGINEMVMFYLG